MAGESEFVASVNELQAVLLGTDGIAGFLRELAGLAARTLGAGVSCGITLQTDGRPLTAASSDASAAQVDELQYGLDSGPCLTALRRGEEIRVDDLAADPRWADYAALALAHGVRSSLSLPLTALGQPVGALNLYSGQPGFFGAAETGLARRLAREAAVTVGLAGRLANQAVLTEQLRASLSSRAVIDQATGVIMAQQRCTAAEAFALLRAASQSRNVKVHEIADQIVTSVTGQPPQAPPFSTSG